MICRGGQCGCMYMYVCTHACMYLRIRPYLDLHVHRDASCSPVFVITAPCETLCKPARMHVGIQLEEKAEHTLSAPCRVVVCLVLCLVHNPVEQPSTNGILWRRSHHLG
ncbi:uncharacterized protein P884DRAFT_260077 [Thermothelomyces heterothallicus CBS 202.75]|uniref:uncharacterized protein n=1 Tax=Thermothelomyces heterothallicus CBS 202.75 TaxID=1149848 RepID=UPI00374258A0